MGEFAIGQPVPRFEDPRLVKGGGRYVADMVFPGMAFGYVLRSPHAHARIRSIDTAKAKAAPGVLAVLTGADYKAAGFGDLPVPGGLKRRDGAPGYRPRYPALVEDRVRMIGDYVAFVVAETYYQAVDAAELIEIDYEPLPAIVSTGDAVKPGVAAGLGRLPEQHRLHPDRRQQGGDRRRLCQGRPRRQASIRRSTASPPRPWSRAAASAIYEPIEGRYTIYTTLQRTNVFQTELSQQRAESARQQDPRGRRRHRRQLRHEVGRLSTRCALVLLGAKLTGRPVKWMATRSESFLCDAQARDNVTDAELALDKDGNFLGFRAKIIAAIGAYLQTGMPAFTGNLGTLAGVYRDAGIAYRRHRGVHAHPAGAALSRQRPAGSGLRHRAHGRSRRRPDRHRSGGAAPAQHHSARAPCRSRPSVDVHLRLRRVRKEHGHGARRRRRRRLRNAPRGNRASAASCAASASPTPSSAPARAGLEGAEIRFDRTGSVSIFSGSINQGQGHETAFKQVVCDKPRPRSERSHLHPGRHRPGVLRRRHRRLALGGVGGSAFTLARREDRSTKAKAIAAHMLKVDADDIKFADGVFSSAEDQPDDDDQGGRQGRRSIRTSCRKAWRPGSIATAIYTAKRRAIPNGCHVCEARDRSRTPASSRSCATTWSTTSAP